MAEGRLASNRFDAWVNAGQVYRLLYNQQNLLFCLNQGSFIHNGSFNLYVLQSTEGNKSFLWHKQLNYDITAILQIWVNA